jgi:phosphoglycerate dehydrogenase-like enzyme
LFPALRDGPVLLTNGRGVFSDALGEFVIGAVLFFAKQFRRMVRGQEAGVWDQFDTMMIAGRTMGIVGYGDIGHAAAKRAHALGMKVLSVRRRPQLSQGDALVDEVMGPDRLGELLARSDYVVVTAPLTPETRGLIGDAEFGAMRPETVIINVGRGPVIDEGALLHALQAKRIRGAALDVFHSEPLPADHPFYRLDNVLLSPHCADRTADWREQAMRLFLDNFGRFRRGEPLLNLVDKRLGY